MEVAPSGGGAQPTGTSRTDAGPTFFTGSVKSSSGKAVTETPRAPSRGAVRAVITPGRPGTLTAAPPGRQHLHHCFARHGRELGRVHRRGLDDE